jgi:hypothetical protein
LVSSGEVAEPGKMVKLAPGGYPGTSTEKFCTCRR